MAQLVTYLTFNGNCREAMTFYRECLGGELSLETIGASPLAAGLPEKMKEYILQATLVHDGFVLLGTDMVGEDGLSRGNAISILVECGSRKELKNYFSKLSAEGEATYPIKKGVRGNWFGSLTDRFGNHWLLSCR